MKRIKSVVSVVLSLIIIVSMFICYIPSAGAATVFTVDGVQYSVISNFEAHVYSYEGTNPVVEIPEKIDARVITAVDDFAFFNNQSLEQVILPKSITSIGDKAFMFCKNLNYVKIPVGVESIGGYAFDQCTSLRDIDLTSSISVISMNTFENSGISSIVIPFTVQELEKQSFRNCKSLTSAVIPTSVKKIGYEAFRNCPVLESVVIYNKDAVIDSNVFELCPNVTIIGYFDSTAEEYAAANNIPFAPIVNSKPGDVDKDGEILISDVTAIQKAIAGTQVLTKEQNYLADVSKDGNVTIDDATAIQKYIAELITSFE